MAEAWTARRVLAWMAEDFRGRGIQSARLDAELLLAHALGLDRVRLYMDLDRPLSGPELEGARALVERRRRREPVAYIRGVREFYGRPFAVSPAVLVPRPETELLVEAALAVLPAEAAVNVLDLCTGSGVAGITLALERPAARVHLTDLSAEALAVARANVDSLGAGGRVTTALGDLFAAVPADARYDVIVANPPYVREEALAGLAPEVRDHEPRLALVGGGADGLALIRRIVADAPAFLVSGGTLALEIGEDQGEAILHVDGAGAFEAPRVVRDLAGLPRVATFRRAP